MPPILQGAVMQSTRRRFGRFERTMPVELSLSGNMFTCDTVNLGLGGMLVDTERSAPLGTPISVRLEVPEPRHTVEIDGSVAWSRPGGLGIAFDALRPIDVWALLRFFNDTKALVDDG